MSMTISIKSPGELVGTIPYLLGFSPGAGSLVYMSLGNGPVARIDMTDDVTHVIDTFTPLWLQQAPDKVALIIYTSDDDKALQHASGLTGHVQGLGGQMVLALQVSDGRCKAIGGDGTWYDVEATPPGVAELVANGVSPLASREEAEGRLRTDDDHLGEPEFEAALDAFIANGKPAMHQAAVDLQQAMRQHLEDATLPTDDVIPTFALALQHKGVRDIAWSELTRRNARQHAHFFLHLYRRCPVAMTAPICGLLAFATWLHGSQAPLAWAAVDKALELDPEYTMALLVRQALEGAMNPDHWTPVDDEAVARMWESLS